MSQTPAISITDNAANRIKAVVTNKEGAIALRIRVAGGGCSGFQYIFSIETAPPTEKDLSFVHNNAQILIDKDSIPLIEGSEIEYVEDVLGSSFRVNNPNATAACGCGTSFSVF